MYTLFVFILGLIYGWLIKWLMDFLRKPGRITHKTPGPARMTGVSTPEHDDLKVIKGIGIVIEKRLNTAGIFTFGQLGSLKPGDLRSILGRSLRGLASEESLLRQARDLARRK